MGFRATDDADDVVVGTASRAELTPEQHCALFVDLCTKLRAMGATEVRAEQFRAVFAPAMSMPSVSVSPVPAPAVTVTRVQLGPKPPEEKLEAFEGEQLSEADKERRRGYRRLAELEGGS